VTTQLVSELRNRNFANFKECISKIPYALDRLEKYKFLEKYQSDHSVIDVKKKQIVVAVDKILDKVAEKYVIAIFTFLYFFALLRLLVFIIISFFLFQSDM
jgi:hypothetical protein